MFFFKFIKLHLLRKFFTRRSKNFIKSILDGNELLVVSYTLSRAKSNGTIHFVLSLKFWRFIVFFVEPPKTLYFLRNSFSLRFREKSSQIKTFSRKVFFMFCLDYFSLNCIIEMLNFKVNDPLESLTRV